MPMPTWDRWFVDHLDSGASALHAPEIPAYTMLIADFGLVAFSLLRRLP